MAQDQHPTDPSLRVSVNRGRSWFGVPGTEGIDSATEYLLRRSRATHACSVDLCSDAIALRFDAVNLRRQARQMADDARERRRQATSDGATGA